MPLVEKRSTQPGNSRVDESSDQSRTWYCRDVCPFPVLSHTAALQVRTKIQSQIRSYSPEMNERVTPWSAPGTPGCVCKTQLDHLHLGYVG